MKEKLVTLNSLMTTFDVVKGFQPDPAIHVEEVTAEEAGEAGYVMFIKMPTQPQGGHNMVGDDDDQEEVRHYASYTPRPKQGDDGEIKPQKKVFNSYSTAITTAFKAGAKNVQITKKTEYVPSKRGPNSASEEAPKTGAKKASSNKSKAAG